MLGKILVVCRLFEILTLIVILLSLLLVVKLCYVLVVLFVGCLWVGGMVVLFVLVLT